MKFAYVYVIAALLFLMIDSIWLGVVARGFYQSHFGSLLLERPRIGVAAVFYALYVVGLLYFALVPGLNAGSLSVAVFRSALFGFFCYLTYDASNLATLKGYSASVAVADVIWGTVLTAIVGGATFLIVRGLSLWQA